MATKPLGLPEGSVRAILAIMSILGLFLCVVLNLPGERYFVALAGMGMGYYFGIHTSLNNKGT